MSRPGRTRTYSPRYVTPVLYPLSYAPKVDRVGFEPRLFLARETCYRYTTQPIGVTDGDRTRNLGDHGPALCQLSYRQRAPYGIRTRGLLIDNQVPSSRLGQWRKFG